MPSYEVENLANPETRLLDEIRFGGAKRTSSNCKADGRWLICHAEYEFAGDVKDHLEVECTLYRVTVPNHVHILYATQAENSDQKVFDQNTSMADLRFHPPSLWELMSYDAISGATLKSVSSILFLIALALSSRSLKEEGLLILVLLIAEWAARPIAPFIPIAISAEFVEAVKALTVAYLAAELILVPDGRGRWVVVLLFGLIHGLPFAAVRPLQVTAAMAMQGVGFAGAAYLFDRAPQSWRKTCAGLVFILAVAWFVRFVAK
jgi:hypothetical protein